MKVETVKIKEFKVLENIEQEIKGNHILLMGDNGVGKSSFIQFIEIALGKQSNIPFGAKGKGEVVFTKDGKPITVKLEFKDGKPYIKVSGNGVSIDNKKSAIAELFGALDFNIDEFVELSKSTAGRKEQIKIFKSFLPPEIIASLDVFDANVTKDYNDRADLNKLLKEKQGFIKSHRLNSVIGIKKFAHKEIKEVIEKLNGMKDHNRKVEDVKKRYEERENECAVIQNKIAELTDDLNIKNGLQEKSLLWMNENIPHKLYDVDLVNKELDDVEKDNQDFKDSEYLKKEIELANTMTDEAGELTAKIESSKEAIANAIREMESPIEGLLFDDETLLYKGVAVNPDCLSTSEIMELGIRLKMAENPELGILFIQRGESLGTDRLKVIKDLADRSGWQLIIEQVERGEKKLHIEIMSDDLT